MRPKARFTGATTVRVSSFSDRLRERLRTLYPHQETTSPVWGDRKDAFVESLLSQAHWAGQELKFISQAITRQEVRAEFDALRSSLVDARAKLRALSPLVDNMLGERADPLGCADAIGDMLSHLDTAQPSVDEICAPKRVEREHAIAVELAHRVVLVLRDYDVGVAATAVPDYDTASIAVQILKLVGDDMGLVRSTATWRDTLADVIAARR